jgi:hypothetical protein
MKTVERGKGIRIYEEIWRWREISSIEGFGNDERKNGL